MGADNWTTCPRCAKHRETELRAVREDISVQYGRITLGEFDTLREMLAEIRSAELAKTFREDYEITGAGSGTVTVHYSGLCTACGLDTSFKYEHKI